MQKKKLLFLTVGFDTGGTEKATYDIITHIDPEKYDITLMSMYGGGYYESQLPEYVHKKHFFSHFIRYVIRLVEYLPGRLIHRFFIREKYDVEIACGDGKPSRVINCSPNKSAKKIAWIHMDVIARGYTGHGMKTAWGRKRFYSNFDRIVNVSKACENQFIKKFGASLPTMTIYNPVDTANILKKASEKPRVTLPPDCFNIVCMGRFMNEKGFDRLVDAYSEIEDKVDKKVRITIIGDGYLRNAIQNRIDEKGLSETIVLAGYQKNPYAILAQAELFLLSSRDESFALVIAEAMVLGVPVISTRCAGPIELLQDGKAGLLVENSTEGIKNGLFQILSDDAVYLQMKKTALENTGRFHINEQIEEIEKLFDELLAR